MKRVLSMGLVGLLAIGAVACGTEGYEESGDMPAVEESVEEVVEAPDEGAAELSEVLDEAPEVEPAAPEPEADVANEESEAPPFEVKKELEATDPAGVQLASGRPQLVEFFAFW